MSRRRVTRTDEPAKASARRETKRIRCAIYTRKSSEEGLDQEFNSLDAQRESAEAYIASQKAEGWVCLPGRYDDAGFSGGSMERPALERLLSELTRRHWANKRRVTAKGKVVGGRPFDRCSLHVLMTNPALAERIVFERVEYDAAASSVSVTFRPTGIAALCKRRVEEAA